MIKVALFEPEIPPNTGNIARLCGAVGVPLHLIGPLGFRTDDKTLKRAGLDYWDSIQVFHHDSLEDFEKLIPKNRIFCFSSRAVLPLHKVVFQQGDGLLFGPESHGLPDWIIEKFSPNIVLIPMPGAKSIRSLNLATSVGIAVYECLRQLHGW